ncbi:MAG: helix-turn-helix transcriptional regulator [Treponema sp.]|nr:helix-turn-helix transcriptional regulator [Treponema sp.]
MGFKENLRDEMEFQDIKPKELSEKTGISVNTLRNYINNHDALPNIDSAVKIAKALNITVEELVEGRKLKNEFQKSEQAAKFLSIFIQLSENDKKSVIALLEEMRSHK